MPQESNQTRLKNARCWIKLHDSGMHYKKTVYVFCLSMYNSISLIYTLVFHFLYIINLELFAWNQPIFTPALNWDIEAWFRMKIAAVLFYNYLDTRKPEGRAIYSSKRGFPAIITTEQLACGNQRIIKHTSVLECASKSKAVNCVSLVNLIVISCN